MTFSPDGKRLISGSGDIDTKDSEVKVWDAQTGEEKLALKGHTRRVWTVAFSPDGKRIASGSGRFPIGGVVKIWDAQTGEQQVSLEISNEVCNVAFSPDGKRIAARGFNTVTAWAIADDARGREPSPEAEKREAERKADLEARGLAYYPKPTTQYENRNAEEWIQMAHDARNPAMLKQALTALKALKEEGMPFLLEELDKSLKSASWNKVDYGLDFIDPEHVHANDLPKLVACLKKVESARFRDNPARVQALTYLSKRKESKKYIDQIEELVKDLKRHTTYGSEVMGLLEAIKSQK